MEITRVKFWKCQSNLKKFHYWYIYIYIKHSKSLYSKSRWIKIEVIMTPGMVFFFLFSNYSWTTIFFYFWFCRRGRIINLHISIKFERNPYRLYWEITSFITGLSEHYMNNNRQTPTDRFRFFDSHVISSILRVFGKLKIESFVSILFSMRWVYDYCQRY